MTDNRLILASANPDSTPLSTLGGVSGLIAALQDYQFIGKAIDEGLPLHYHSGPKIMNCISLVGCSPVYALTDSSDEPAGIVSFSPVYSEMQFIYGANTMTPKCTQCHQTMGSWKNLLPEPLAVCNVMSGDIECEHCAQSNSLRSLRFRREAVVGRFFINIHGIYPREAVPMDDFLSFLQRFIGGSLNYFYCQGQ
ncbi:hypothetical protein MNBD_GAMMA12-2998 [hydrothermal vent metagenome]|uniref:Uncharacterized protein n=1 Tax=hydrothermal vent metagenome TaxID=652676 RepID=A0A3B0YU10_9ZZZZ